MSCKWEMVRLGDVFSIIRNGVSIKQDKNNSGIPITRIETIADGTINRNKMGYANIFSEEYADYYLMDNDILMSHINSEKHLGKTALYRKEVGEKIIHGMNLLCLRPSNIFPMFALYYFKSPIFKNQIIPFTKKSVNQASFTITDLKTLLIPLPPLETQHKIATILDKVTHLINLHKKQLEKLDLLVKSRFVEMFGDPVTNPMGWETKTINEVAPAVPYKGKLLGKVWLLNLDMIESQTGKIINYNYVNDSEVGNSTCIFDEENVLYSKLRPYLNKVVVPDRKGYATTELVPLRPNHLLERDFLAALLRSDSFVTYINEKVAGSKMPRVTMSDFREFKCILPPIELQTEFADFVKSTDKTKKSVQKSLDKLEILKKSLMQKYFS